MLRGIAGEAFNPLSVVCISDREQAEKTATIPKKKAKDNGILLDASFMNSPKSCDSTAQSRVRCVISSKMSNFSVRVLKNPC